MEYQTSPRHKFVSYVSLIALLLNLIPFNALPARAAKIDQGEPAAQAHHAPRPELITRRTALTPVGNTPQAITPAWFNGPAITPINETTTAGLSLARPRALVSVPPAAPRKPSVAALPDWFNESAGNTASEIAHPNSEFANPVPDWFNVPAELPQLTEVARRVEYRTEAAPPPAWYAPANVAMPAGFIGRAAEAQGSMVADSGQGAAIAPEQPTAFLPGWFNTPAEIVTPKSEIANPLPAWFASPPLRPLEATISGLTINAMAPPLVSAGDEAIGGSVYTVVVRNTNATLTAYDLRLDVKFERQIGAVVTTGVGFSYVGGSVNLVSSVSGTITVTEQYTPSLIYVTFTPSDTFNLPPGGVATFTYKFETNGLAESGQRMDVALYYQNPPGSHNIIGIGENVTVGRGNLVIAKTPSFRQGTFGDVLAWNVELANTGQGRVFSATVQDVIGSGYTGYQDTLPGAPISIMEISERRNFVVTATINACQNLTNTALAWWNIGNDEGDGIITNPVKSNVNVKYLLTNPQLSLTANSVSFDYCARPTQTVVLTMSNAANAGAARNLRLIAGQEFFDLGFNLVSGSVSSGWQFDGQRVFTYPGVLMGGEAVTLTFQVQPTDTVCGTETNGSFNFASRYNNACNFRFIGPGGSVPYSFDSANTPSLSVSKNGTLADNNRDATFAIQFDTTNADELTGSIILTDNLSVAYTLVSSAVTPFAGATFKQNGTQFVWTIPTTGLVGSVSGQLTINARVITSELSNCPIDYDNEVVVSARPACPQCLSEVLTDSASADLSPDVRRPQISVDATDLQFDYCRLTPQPVMITLTNAITAGPAFNTRVSLTSQSLDRKSVV